MTPNDMTPPPPRTTAVSSFALAQQEQGQERQTPTGCWRTRLPTSRPTPAVVPTTKRCGLHLPRKLKMPMKLPSLPQRS